MERLTQKDSNGWYIPDQSIPYDERRRGESIDRLASYEDTGLEPEEIEKLISLPNEPLTMEEIRQMRGMPVWCPEVESYGIITMQKIGAWANKPFLQFFWLQKGDDDVGVNCSYNIEERGLTLYRQKPEEGTT